VARRAAPAPDVSKPLGDRIEFLKINQLRLDAKNPRLPKSIQSQGQEAILKFIAENYEPIIVGRSIALHRYFISEPLIVLKARSDTYTVVEGNRRLVALKLLTEKKTRELVDDPEWEELSRKAELPRRGIPAVIATSREEIAPIIGYRHIAGIQEWDPFPKARYITQFIDGPDKLSFAQVAELVGEDVADVKRLYRNYSIIEQAQEEFEVDTSRAEAEFGVFDRAMTGGIREYIGAPVPSGVVERKYPLSGDVEDRVRDALSWIFGDENGNDSVITESRGLTDLSKVLREDAGIETLRRTRNLADALEAAQGGRTRLINRLAEAQSALRSALQDIDAFKDDEGVRQLIAECESAIESVKAVMDG
jgi:hypothetical protein